MSNLGAFSMWDLFRGEVESQMRVFTDGLLALETGGSSKDELAATMRAAHSIKGAARIVHLDVAVQLSHSMEDCLVAAHSIELPPATLSNAAVVYTQGLFHAGGKTVAIINETLLFGELPRRIA